MEAVTTGGRARVERYLLPNERVVVTVRRHWVVLLPPMGLCVLAFLVASWIDVRLPAGVPGVRDLAWLGFLASVGWLIWQFFERQHDWFVVTDERLLRTYGIFTRKVAIMPLMKVTDMSYNVSPLGRLLHFGEFVFESAGRDQALRSVSFLPDSAQLFAALSNELFGPEGVASSRYRRRRMRLDD
ncbi:MAG TPA: PH domain-containing protein [Actinomycetales bacterium]|nr:PH domain-containing protein [Actinomycetales bacterium]